MTHTRYRLLQIAILFGLGFFLLDRITTGKLFWYINIRFVFLTFLGMLGLFALAGNGLELLRRNRDGNANHYDHQDHTHDHSISGLLLLAMPLALGLLIPARPISVDAAQIRGISLNTAPSTVSSSGDNQRNTPRPAPDERTVLDWVRLFNQQPGDDSIFSQPANVIGFVYYDSRLPAGHFLVARFTVFCCVADAFAIGMVVAWPEELPGGAWVNVRGPVQPMYVVGQRLPMILADNIKIVPEPAQPYLFP